MKLSKLAVSRFGGLQGPATLAFDSASTLVYGANEAGKTSFADALRTALFGPPERGRATAEGKTFASRYGDDYSVEAQWLNSQGGVLRSTAEKPTAEEDIPRELFTNLFMLKGGECTLSGKDKLDAGFGSKFAKAVLGAGEVDLDSAIKLLQKISDPKGSTKWSKHDKKLKDELALADAKLADLGRLRELSLKRDKADKAVAELEARLKSAEAELRAAESGSSRLEAEDLASDRARWDNAVSDEEKARLPADAPALTGLEAFAKAESDAGRDCASLESRISERHAESAKLEDALSSLKAKAEALPDKVLCEKLRFSLGDLGTASSNRPASGAYSPVFELLVPLIAAGIGLSLGWMFKGKLGAALGLVVCGFLGWLALSLLKGKAGTGQADQEKLLSAFRPVAASLKWPDVPEQCAKKLSERDAEETRLLAEISARREALESAKTDVRRLETELSEAKSKLSVASADLSRALSKTSVSSIKAYISRKADWEAAKRTAEHLEASLRGRLGIESDKPVSELKTKLQARITELKEAGLTSESSQLKRESLKPKLESARSLREKLLKDLEASRRSAESARLEASQVQASIGGGEAAILAKAQQARAAVDDLSLWRRAAEEACATVRRLSADTGKRVAELVQDASPIFSELTAGRYSGLELQGPSIFEEESLRAVHSTLGSKPVEWLSKGTQDLLWLCLRMALARRIRPEGSLLVLDEPFLTLDPGRAGKALEALLGSKWLKGWQVLILTKDPAMVPAASAAGVRVLDL
ncbi:MAG: AAA family ATPase [Elusimicrobia bacterium]|nr:AAA family ATPase [Elusimicrobiota bacterium]